MSLLPYALPAGSLLLALPYLRQRLALSRAKHRSLAGHSRMAKRLAGWLPGYAFDEQTFFKADGANDALAAQRRAAFETLCAGYAERYAKSLAPRLNVFTDPRLVLGMMQDIQKARAKGAS